MIAPRHRDRSGRRRRWGPVQAAGLGALALLAVMVAAALSLGEGREQEPAAPPAVLDRIAQKNREAAADAAARMKAESAAVTSAADARRRDAYEGRGGPEEPDR